MIHNQNPEVRDMVKISVFNVSQDYFDRYNIRSYNACSK
jgi:hypothetical protein